MHPAEKVYTRSGCFYEYLVGMKRKLEPRFEKFGHRWQKIFQVSPVLVHDHKVVSITDAIADFQFPFQKLVELVHINIHEKLAREVPERQADVGLALRMEAVDDFGKEPKRVVVLDTM